MSFTPSKLIRGLIAFVIGLIAICTIAFYLFPLPGHIPILMYHFIGTQQETAISSNYVTLQTFEKQMRFLKQFGYRVISLDDLNEIRKGKRAPRGREVVLTFDDGNPSVFQLAWPLLKKNGFPSTQFLIAEGLRTGTYGSVSLNNIQSLLKEPLLNWEAHSRTHRFFSELSDQDLESEILGSKKELEKMLGLPIQNLAYPFGDFDQRSMEIAEKVGYEAAFTTSPKKLKGLKAGPYCIPRVKVSESDSNLFLFWGKLSALYDWFKLWRHYHLQKKSSSLKTQ